MIVPDVNVLIYAFREDQPDHGRYREWLTAAFAADEPVALPGHVFSGFMRVVSPTRGCSRPPRLPTRLRGTCSSLSAPRRRWARLRVVACSTAADRCGAFRGRLALTPNGGVAVGPVLAPAIEKLPEAIARLVEGFDPLRIVVFGSHARGEAHPGSDLDLLVVVPHLGDKRETAVGMTKALRGLRAAIDVVPTDPDEIARRGETPGDVLRSALREGKTVYERDA